MVKRWILNILSISSIFIVAHYLKHILYLVDNCYSWNITLTTSTFCILWQHLSHLEKNTFVMWAWKRTTWHYGVEKNNISNNFFSLICESNSHHSRERPLLSLPRHPCNPFFNMTIVCLFVCFLSVHSLILIVRVCVFIHLFINLKFIIYSILFLVCQCLESYWISTCMYFR